MIGDLIEHTDARRSGLAEKALAARKLAGDRVAFRGAKPVVLCMTLSDGSIAHINAPIGMQSICGMVRRRARGVDQCGARSLVISHRWSKCNGTPCSGGFGTDMMSRTARCAIQGFVGHSGGRVMQGTKI